MQVKASFLKVMHNRLIPVFINDHFMDRDQKTLFVNITPPVESEDSAILGKEHLGVLAHVIFRAA